MNPVTFPGVTITLKKPSDMTDQECGSLPIRQTKKDSHPAMESVWELSEDEIALIIKSKRIRVGVIGTMHPPFYIQVEPESDEVEFEMVGSNLDWVKAKEHLDKAVKLFTGIGQDGLMSLNFILNPLLTRFESGERTKVLHDSIMQIEV